MSRRDGVGQLSLPAMLQAIFLRVEPCSLPLRASFLHTRRSPPGPAFFSLADVATYRHACRRQRPFSAARPHAASPPSRRVDAVQHVVSGQQASAAAPSLIAVLW